MLHVCVEAVVQISIVASHILPLGLRSDYLAIATLGISEIILYVLKFEDWLTRGVKNVNGFDLVLVKDDAVAGVAQLAN